MEKNTIIILIITVAVIIMAIVMVTYTLPETKQTTCPESVVTCNSTFPEEKTNETNANIPEGNRYKLPSDIPDCQPTNITDLRVDPRQPGRTLMTMECINQTYHYERIVTNVTTINNIVEMEAFWMKRK